MSLLINKKDLPKPQTREDREKWRAIQGKIAEALRDRFARMTAAVDELDRHLEHCKECQASEDAYRLCPTGNRLCHAALNA